MKMKKVLAIFMSVSLLATVFSGCTPANQVNDKDEQGRTVISVGSWPAKEGKGLETITKQKEEFEKENPTMAIIPDTWGFTVESFYSKAASGQLPTVYYSNFTEIEKIISGEYGADITEGLKRNGYEGKIRDSVMDIISKNGKIYTFPTDVYTLGIACNMDLFKKAGLVEADGTPMQPKTWDEVVEFGKKINEATGKAGFIIPTTGNCGGWLFTPIAWSYGVKFMKATGENEYKATFDSQEMIDALTYISDLKWKHNIFLDNSLISMDEQFKQLAIGNVGMIIAAADYPNYVSKYEMPLENIGMLAIPAGPARRVTLSGGYTATIANGATEDQIDVAIKWLEKTGDTYKLDESIKASMEEKYKLDSENGKAIGIMGLSVYTDDAENRAYELELIEKYRNIDENAVRRYNESHNDTSIEISPEEPACAQELYAILDSVIQEILTNKDANIPELVKKAQADFQSNNLDNMN